MIFFSYLEEIRIQSPDTGIISEQTMSEKQFGQKRKSMEKEIRGSRLVPEIEFLDRSKTMKDNVGCILDEIWREKSNQNVENSPRLIEVGIS